MRGVFVSSYVDFKLSGISISFDTRTGEILDSPPAIASTRFDTWSHWLLLAYQGLARAESALEKVRAAHADDDDNALGPALEEEFREGMATISAAASAVDAFYASVKERYGEHPDVPTWKRTGLARYKQISETLRWAWKLNPDQGKMIRSAVAELYKFRDVALHSPAEFRVTELRAELDRFVEWRFNWYRTENAQAAVLNASRLIAMFLRQPENAPASIQEWVTDSQGRFAAATGYGVNEPDGGPDTETETGS
jgi:hypothetical protein